MGIHKNKLSLPKRSIFRWFFIGFFSFSMIFFIALLPLYNYCRETFTQLKIKEISKQMSFGITQLDSAVSGIMNASASMASNAQFYPLQYRTVNYSAIPVNDRLQMRRYLETLIRPFDLVTDCALQISEEDAVTMSLTTFENPIGYYPFYFNVADLSYDEWTSILSEASPGFLPVLHVTTPYSSYDALIYSINWNRDRYFYASFNVNEIKKTIIESNYLDKHFLTIENAQGDCLYTDCTDNSSNYYTVSQYAVSNTLLITIHIPKTTLHAHMMPLYTFITIYLIVCVLVLLITVYTGSRISAKPLIRIIDAIDDNMTLPSELPKELQNEQSSQLGYGFKYIYNKIQLYEYNIRDYQSTIITQTKVLQARFMEKALHGTLSTVSDYTAFYSYFPHFPKSFCLILFGLLEKTMEQEDIYKNALYLVQYQLQKSLPDVYQQQLSNNTMLLIIDTKEYNTSFDTINNLIAQINQEDAPYHAWGIMSKTYEHPDKIAFAYRQVQDLKGQLSIESLSQLCILSDYKTSNKTTFQMSDSLAIHSAIVAGNNDVALSRLENYADLLISHNRSVCEMIRALLLCIKQEYANLLIDIEIPLYNTQTDMYKELKDVINIFCDQIRAEKEQSDSFGLLVKDYIDSHFCEDTLCSTSLEEHFQCSYTKIRKAFSSSVSIPISSYIEKKRMDLSNELLTSGEYSVAEVAKKCGYINDSTFYKAYRRTYGHAPSSIKKD
ncbi:MAG: helix-turn-helix transcriptional regulator [Lachnospiraceae bacterium]|nr:helix-turn-helix transcriptional regulator [Lachnospiraceae bacterium]